MLRIASVCLIAVAALGAVAEASVIDTNNAATVSAFQTGATVNNFESVTGRTPQTITAYTVGDPVSATAFVFDQISGVQFSVGGAPGTNAPALYSLSGGIAGDAKSPTTVLGPVDFDFTTKFNSSALIEIFFPTKVAKVGFWLNPSLAGVLLIAADTNFAFSGLPETTLESGTVTAGNFVGIERAAADIGGFKIIGLADPGFTIDDFTFGGATTGGGTTTTTSTTTTTTGTTTGTPGVPGPAALVLLACGAAALAWRGRARS
jgi:hypothetical protein